MKKITLSLVMIIIAISVIAQAPQAFKYQAVARDNAGSILANQSVSFQISILQGSASGTIVYAETHSTTTNELGLVSLEIGNGIIVNGDFAFINWGDDSFFLQVEMDETGGTNYQLMGTCQLLSVPYALYSEATGYISTFSCIDYDGNAYPTFTIGTQVWMAENLRVMHYRNGDAIPNVTLNSIWSSLNDGSRCYYNNDSVQNNPVYGPLYNWHAATDNRGLCPAGWHLPTNEEWTELATYLGGQNMAGGKMKALNALWTGTNTGTTSTSGFLGFPGGYRHDAGNFYFIGEYGYWWSSTEIYGTHAWASVLNYINNNLGYTYLIKRHGFSVRCVRD